MSSPSPSGARHEQPPSSRRMAGGMTSTKVQRRSLGIVKRICGAGFGVTAFGRILTAHFMP
jgi:hypothetical protein